MTPLQAFLASEMRAIKKRLAADRNARFRAARAEIHALAAFHHRAIGQRVRQQKARVADNLF